MNDGEVLARILSRDGLYWRYPGDERDDPTSARWIEMRIDAPLGGEHEARQVLEDEGWTLASQPDDAADPVQRLYFRKFQSLDSEQRKATLTAGYKAAVACDGRFLTWINLDDENSN